jgi:hypothetical protein
VNDNLPPSLNRFAAELEQAIRRELGPHRDRRLVRLLRARPRLLAGTTIGAAGTGVVLAIVLGAAGSSPAFAVTRNRDGSYSVTLRSLTAIPAANRKLSQMGLRATLVQAAANCPTQGPPQPVRIPFPIPAPRPPLHLQVPSPRPPLHLRFPAPHPPVHHRIPAPIPPHLRIPVCGPPPLPGGNS